MVSKKLRETCETLESQGMDYWGPGPVNGTVWVIRDGEYALRDSDGSEPATRAKLAAIERATLLGELMQGEYDTTAGDMSISGAYTGPGVRTPNRTCEGSVSGTKIHGDKCYHVTPMDYRRQPVAVHKTSDGSKITAFVQHPIPDTSR